MTGALILGLIGYGCGLTVALVLIVALGKSARRGDDMAREAFARRAQERRARSQVAPYEPHVCEVGPLRTRTRGDVA
jgi:hypothetical protein